MVATTVNAIMELQHAPTHPLQSDVYICKIKKLPQFLQMDANLKDNTGKSGCQKIQTISKYPSLATHRVEISRFSVTQILREINFRESRTKNF